MKLGIILIFLFSFALVQLRAQEKDACAIHLEHLPQDGVLLDRGWKLQAGDNPAWASPGFNDSGWQAVDPTMDIKALPQLWQHNVVWLRLHFCVGSALRQQPLVLHGQQAGASEIYLNGQLIKRLGVISSDPEEVQAYTLPQGQMIPLPLGSGSEQVLAVRFALQKDLPLLKHGSFENPAFSMRVNGTSEAVSYLNSVDDTPYEFLRSGAFLILAVLHLAFFLFYPSQRANLYFFLYALFSALGASTFNLTSKVYQLEVKAYLIFVVVAFFSLNNIFYLRALYRIFNKHKGVFFWSITTALLLFTPLVYWFYDQGKLLIIVVTFLIPLETMRVALLALQRKQRGAKIVAGGAVAFFGFYLLYAAMAYNYLPAGPNGLIGDFVWNISALSFPVSISILLALEFAFTSRSLETKLKEVQQLSEKTLSQEQEKQQILASQNEMLERQVVERTAEVVTQKEKLQTTLNELKATQNQLVHKEKMASLGELTAGIAHEIQNPLNFVNNFSEVSKEMLTELQQELDTGAIKEAKAIAIDIQQNLHKIHHHGNRADSIVKNMLQHSRTSSGEKQLTNLNALADECLHLSYFGIRAKEKSFQCTLDTCFDQSMGNVEVVPQDLGRVLLNLFNNAFYAVQQKLGLAGYEPKVRVSTARQGNQAEIRVWDNGTGISESIKGKIFQPFFTTKPTGQGTGLGLSLSYDTITKGHGGELSMDTVQGEWAEFTITLPYVPVAEESTPQATHYET